MSDNFIHLLIVLGMLGGTAPARPTDAANKRPPDAAADACRKKPNVDAAREQPAPRRVSAERNGCPVAPKKL